MSLRLKTAPATEPITTTEAKTFLRVDSSSEDSLIGTMITAARVLAEEYTLRAFITQTWNLWLDHFPHGRSNRWWDGVVEASKDILTDGSRVIVIPRPPLASIVHIKTYADDNTATTYSSDNYIVDTASQPGRVILENGQVWPADLRSGKAIDVEFTCGYGAASDVPGAIKHAIYLIVGKLYECRGEGDVEIPKAARALLDPYKVYSVGVMNPQRSYL